MEVGVRDPIESGDESCGVGAGDSSCPGCGVDRLDPGHQALEWSARLAQAKPGSSRFWAVALASDAYRDLRSDAEIKASPWLDSVVDGISLLASLMDSELGSSTVMPEGFGSEPGRDADRTDARGSTDGAGATPPGSEKDLPPGTVTVTEDEVWGDDETVPGPKDDTTTDRPTPSEKPTCCCILEKVKLTHVRWPYEAVEHPQWADIRPKGRSIIRLEISFRWQLDDKYRPCVVQWWEKSNYPHLLHPGEYWYDLGDSKGHTRSPSSEFGEWEDELRETWPEFPSEPPPPRTTPGGELRNFLELMSKGCKTEDVTAETTHTSVDHDYPTQDPRRVGDLAHIEGMEKRNLRGAIRVFSGCEKGKRAEIYFTQLIGPESLDIQPEGEGAFSPSDKPALKNAQVGSAPGQIPRASTSDMGEGVRVTEAQMNQEVGWTNAKL